MVFAGPWEDVASEPDHTVGSWFQCVSGCSDHALGGWFLSGGGGTPTHICWVADFNVTFGGTVVLHTSQGGDVVVFAMPQGVGPVE